MSDDEDDPWAVDDDYVEKETAASAEALQKKHYADELNKKKAQEEAERKQTEAAKAKLTALNLSSLTPDNQKDKKKDKKEKKEREGVELVEEDEDEDEIGANMDSEMSKFKGTPCEFFSEGIHKKTFAADFIGAEKRKDFLDSHVKTLVEKVGGLEQISVAFCDKLTDESLGYLSTCKDLRVVHLGNLIKITDEGIKKLVSNCKSIEILNISCCSLLTDASLIAIGQNCSKLKSLKLQRVEKITDKGLEGVAKGCPQVRKLDLSNCYQISPEALKVVGQYSKFIRSLSVNGCFQIKEIPPQLQALMQENHMNYEKMPKSPRRG